MEGAYLSSANLGRGVFVATKMAGVDLPGSRVYDVSDWDVEKAGAVQKDLLIEAERNGVLVDDLEIA